MRQSDNTRFYQSFPSVIPVCGASSLRVTHPSALARLCKHSFAKDLHVLSILSAFILSQDQTLHSIYLHIFKFHLISLDVIFFKILDFIDYTLNCFFMLLISLLSVDTFSYRQDIYYHKKKYLSTTFLKIFLNFLNFISCIILVIQVLNPIFSLLYYYTIHYWYHIVLFFQNN